MYCTAQATYKHVYDQKTSAGGVSHVIKAMARNLISVVLKTACRVPVTGVPSHHQAATAHKGPGSLVSLSRI